MSAARRHFMPIFLGLVVIFLLVSCRLSAPRQLPPEDVLRRAIIANSLMDHVSLFGTVSVHSKTLSGSVRFVGTLEGGGTSWWISGPLLLRRSTEIEHSYLSGSLTLLSLDHHTLGLRLDSPSGILADRLMIHLKPTIDNSWFSLALGTGSVALPSSSRVGVDEVDSILRLFSIGSARPFEKSATGRYQYSFSLSTLTGADLANTTAWRGDVWIDAVSFEMQRVRWRPAVHNDSDDLTISLVDVSFTSDRLLNRPQLQSPPVALSLHSLSDIILGKPLLP